MSIDLSKMSISEIQNLQKQIEERIAGVKEEIETHHHPKFINKVGLEILMDIPVVDAKALGLEAGEKYPQRVVTPEKLGEKNVVRGLDGANRPFIAIKVDLLDSKTNIKVAQVVEVVFKRYSLHCDGKNDGFQGKSYVTALSNKGDDGKNYQSGLYGSGGMINSQFERVKQLLKGETIEHEFDKSYLMKMTSD